MRDIRELFHSEGLSLYETLSTNDVIGFLVPLYQRRYAWDIDHVDRMLQDVVEGMRSLKYDDDALSFIGAVIFVDSEVEAFRSKAMSIVDGQQRLTTAILTCSVLHQVLQDYVFALSGNSGEFIRKLIDSCEERQNELFACFAKSKVPIPKKSSDYYPILIREHADQWGKVASDCEYKSPVSSYLSQYINFVYSNANSSFSWQKPRDGVDINYFSQNEQFIRDWFETKIWGEDLFSDVLNNILNSRIGPHLLGYSNDSSAEFISGYKRVKNIARVKEALVLLCYSEFFLRRLAITNVRVADERYGFDIFESLNTTGSPLTAIETFKPVVARYLDSSRKECGGYERSDAKIIFDEIDEYMDSKRLASAKTKESQKQVITFSYLAFGEKLSTKLDIQRTSLKKRYESLPTSPPGSRDKFVQVLGAVSEFRKNFWDSDLLAQQLVAFPIEVKEEALFHLDFIRGSKTEMAIPILLRYWLALDTQIDSKDFLGVCRATASFIAMWRAYTGNTGAIDSAFRSLLVGKQINGRQYKGVRLGMSLDAPLLSIRELKQFYVALLKGKKIVDSKSWVLGASEQPLYSSSQDLCRYLLLLAHHQASFQNGKLVKNAERPQEKLNYKKLSAYRHRHFKTLEHVAPQNAAANWDNMFEKNPVLVHTLGNLALLPTAENNAVGNKSWKAKKLMFRAFAESDRTKLESIIVEADKMGMKLKDSVTKLLDSGDSLAMLGPLLNIEKWDHQTVKVRTKNLLNCVWEELDDALQFSCNASS